MKLINKKQNKACSLQENGTHRIYSDNKRKNTQLFIYTRLGFELAYQRLLKFGYADCTESEFEKYFMELNTK